MVVPRLLQRARGPLPRQHRQQFVLIGQAGTAFSAGSAAPSRQLLGKSPEVGEAEEALLLWLQRRGACCVSGEAFMLSLQEHCQLLLDNGLRELFLHDRKAAMKGQPATQHAMHETDTSDCL